MFAYLKALNKNLNKNQLEAKMKSPEVIRNLASRAFEIPFPNIIFDSVTGHFYVRNKEGSAIANISLETGNVKCHHSYEEGGRNFARIYEKDFYSLIGERKIIVEVY